MQYNTDRKYMRMPEYGRNVQKLVDYAMREEDKKKRQDIVEQIIILMEAINPNAKNVGDYEHKLWDHLHIISDFKLEIESPYPAPTPEEVYKKPEKFDYPNSKIKYRHYGKNVESLIKKAVAMEDEEKQEAFTELIASFMKRTYENYHNERVNDEIIKEDLERISKGELSVDDDQRIVVKREAKSNRRPNTPNNNKRRYKSNNNNKRYKK